MTKIISQTEPDYDETRIVERPDGFYWTFAETGELFGPYPTLIEAVQDMNYKADANLEPAETLEEVEDELGLTGWVDPDTGELAEDTLTHLEDH